MKYRLAALLLGALPDLWQYLRFVPLSLFIFIAVGALYAASLDQKIPFRRLLPGILLSMLSWLVITVGFSVYVENVAPFALMYGALGAVIALLLWLFLSAFALILGAEWNASLIAVHAQDEEETVC